jgi:hypothetical protein
MFEAVVAKKEHIPFLRRSQLKSYLTSPLQLS